MVGLNRKASSRRNEARIGWETINVLEPDVMFREETAHPIHFGRTFVHSDAFKALFQEGMELVEETAAYLDGAGREDSRVLSRQGTLTYASESMRLTTRLMQIASASRPASRRGRGDHPDQAEAEKNRVRLASQGSITAAADFEALRGW